MARKGTFQTEPRSEQYDLKQSLVRTGYGHLPEDLRVKAMAQVNVQKSHWASGFGVLHKAWMAVAQRVLAPANIPKLQYAVYKAFTNEYVSKVQVKGTELSEEVKAKFTRQGADGGVLDNITAVIGEVLSA
jgi:hypothetical protein